MTELFDTKRIRDDQEHWDALAARVARTAVTVGRLRRVGLVSFTGSRRGLFAAAVLTAVAAGILLIARIQLPDGPVNELNESLQPTDDIGRTFTASVGPPSIGALLLTADAAGGGRPK